MSTGPLLAAAALAQLAGILVCRRYPRVWLTLTVASAALAFAAGVNVLASGAAWTWSGDARFLGEPAHAQLDALSALFLVLTATIGGAGAVYGREYWADRRHPRSASAGRGWWNVLLLCLGVVLLAANGLHFLLGWELFTLAAFVLIKLDSQPRAVRDASWLYLGASHVGTIALFAFFAGLAAHTGSWALGPMHDRPEVAPLFWLALFGFGLKSGAFPLHIWLPSAHANAPSHVSAMLSGVTIKLGIYGLVRFSGWLPVPANAPWTVAGLGVASAVLGVAFALGQHDLKRLLAYHSVENIGIILIGLGFALVAASQPDATWGPLVLAGGLLHVWNHGLFKALLFLGAGAVLHATGTREMSRLGGLWRVLPWTASLFALGAAAISGLPPLNGFVSEWLVYLGLFDAAITRGPVAWTAVPAAILLGVTGALALACFVKVCGVVFLGAPRSPAAARAHECGSAMRGPMLLLGGACVAIGLGPLLFWPAIAAAVGAWRPDWAGAVAPVSLSTLGWVHVALAVLGTLAALWLWGRTRRAGPATGPTWDCGYTAPTARMQYTAGSFAGIITEWFAWILRPTRHAELPGETFPAHARFASHTPETVLDHLLTPAAGVVLQVAAVARRLQHGRLQSYLLYLLAGVAGIAALVVTGGGQ